MIEHAGAVRARRWPVAAPARRFRIEIRRSGGSVVVALAGELDLAVVPIVGDVVATVLASPTTALRISLLEVTFIDAAGVRALVSAAARARAESATFGLLAPSPRVSRVLEVAGLSRAFEVMGG